VALRSDALLVRWTTSGTLRVSGGAFERNPLMLWVFGADGLLTRWEQFEPEREAEALARFDALAAGPSPRPITRRVRANAATACIARLDAVMARRDADALASVFAEGAEFVEHVTGAVYDRQGMLFSASSFLKARDPTFRNEPLATLGSSLALHRFRLSASGLVGGNLDVGAYDRDEVVLSEVDAHGQLRRNEFFARDRLGDAVVRP